MSGDLSNKSAPHGAFDAVGHALLQCSRTAAVLGGTIVLGVTMAVTVSIIKRTIGLGGISGDFEIVEFGCGIAAFLFMPYCQIKRGHVTVDLFTAGMNGRARNALDGIWELFFAAIWAILVWRMTEGMIELHEYDDRSMLLALPLWVVHVPAIFSVALSSLIALYATVRFGRDVFRAPKEETQ